MKHNKNRLISVLTKCLLEHYRLNNTDFKTRVNYQLRVNNIIEFLGERTDFLITELDLAFASSFREWCNKKYSVDHASRNVELLKKVTKYAKVEGLISYDPISNMVTSRAKPKEVIHITNDELNLIINNKHYDQLTKDCYIVQSLTGLSYGDLTEFKVVEDGFGEWVTGNRIKSPNNEYWIPLHPIVKRILKEHGGKLPRIPLTSYNREIKIIAKQLGINKNLTTHTARKTFATLMYDKGVSEDTIADMMGISVFILRKHYLKKSRRRIEAELSTITL